jgi:hypothetical protein
VALVFAGQQVTGTSGVEFLVAAHAPGRDRLPPVHPVAAGRAVAVPAGERLPGRLEPDPAAVVRGPPDRRPPMGAAVTSAAGGPDPAGLPLPVPPPRLRGGPAAAGGGRPGRQPAAGGGLPHRAGAGRPLPCPAP